jgi:beta-glucosidase
MTKVSKWVVFVFLVSFFHPLFLSSQVYLDPEAPVDDRVEDLLSRMTLEEKAGQMTQAERGQFTGGNLVNIRNHFVGSVLSGGGSSPGNTVTSWIDMYNDFQEQAMATRLGIPMIYGVDAVHGHNNVKGAVIFPHNIGLGCTRNPELVEECSRITALEVSATGIDWTFSPCVAVPRNERWGRTYEGFGEEPGWVSLFAEAAVKGYQGDTLAAPESILACAKHYIADGGTAGGVNAGNALLSETALREIHLPPFRSSIDAGAGSVMASFNRWNGDLCHGSKYLLTDVLKDELGFEGFVISDWKGINQLDGNFKLAIRQAVNAGIDMAMQPDDYLSYKSNLIDLVNEGQVSMDRIDDAVSRILRVKFELGLFEEPYATYDLVDTVGCATHREVGRQAVRESLVLLKNENQFLPISKDIDKVAVVGPKANDIGAQCGGWSISWQGSLGNITEGTTVRQAVVNALGAEKVVYTANTTIPEADAAIVVVGEAPYAEGAGDRPPGNAGMYLNPGEQAMIEAVKNKGIPFVVVLLSGRPLLIAEQLEQADAFIAAWLPGTEGDGIADVLFGDFVPVGKLSHSWPASESDIPVNFGDPGYDPLFEYGFGLSYVVSTAPEVEEEGDQDRFFIYPNPVGNELNLSTDLPGHFILVVTDLQGKLRIREEVTMVSSYTLDLKTLESGTYFLQIDQGYETEVHTFIKE